MQNTKYIFLLLSTILVFSCTKKYEDLIKDPESINAATPGSFLNSTLLNTTSTALTKDHDLFMDMIQVTVSTVQGISVYHRYIIPASQSNTPWSSYYLALTDLNDMENISRNNNDSNYIAIAKTLKVYLFQQLTDIYGDIPYFHSLEGYSNGNYQPSFDDQQVIYNDLVLQLDSANNLYNNKVLDYGTDILYGADVSASKIMNWKKFTNSLRLRVLMRMEGKSDAAKQKIKEMLGSQKANYPLISSNTESAVVNYTGTTPLLNPFYNYRNYDFNGADVMSSFWADSLNAWKDPRLSLWFTKNSNGTYTGIPSGYTVAQSDSLAALSSAYLNKKLKTIANLGILIQYAEVEFLLAEAAQKGYSSDLARSHYENAITASITYWGGTLPNNFLSTPGIAYDGSLKQLITQKYFSLFFQEVQQWSEYRRTGYPSLKIGPGVENNGILPTRMVYPLNTQSLNNTNYKAEIAKMGADNMQVKVWWAK